MKKFIIPLSAFVVFALLAAPALYAAFTSTIDLTSNNAHAPVIDLDGAGVIHAAWEEVTATGSDIIYAQSTDDGVTFPAVSRINLSSTASLISTNPQIKVDSADNIYIVWEEDDPVDGEPEVYFVKSGNGGISFSAKQNISNDSLFSGSAYIETSASDKIHIVWTNSTPSDEYWQVYYSSSTNGGSTFSAPVNISGTIHDVDQPIVRSDDSLILVVWRAEGSESGIYRVVSSDNGLTFGSALNVGGDTTTQISNPSIGIDGSARIHISAASFATSEPEIIYFRSTDNGATFDAGLNLSNSAGDISETPSLLAVGNGQVFIAWSENTCDGGGCKKTILLRRSTNGGSSFQAATSPDEFQVLTSATQLDFDVFGLNVYMIWEQSGIIQFMKGK